MTQDRGADGWTYFERRLGKPVEHRVQIRDSRDPNARGDDARAPRRPEDRSLTEWMETFSEAWTTRDVEPVPEANFLRALSDNAFVVILGEPGSGKSWLAANMARTLARAFLDPGWLERREAMPRAPIFARFRALKASRPGEGVSAWDVIEDWSAEFGHPITPRVPPHHRPVFILDGLDELRIDARASLARSLHDLPGAKILTCRTAVWETELRAAFTQPNRPAPAVYRLLGLNDQEQRRFLESRALPDGTTASALLQRVRANPSLRALAGNPLLLGLIAEEGASLPANRAELYASTICKRWRELEASKPLVEARRTLTPIERDELETTGNAFLAALAARLAEPAPSSDTGKASLRTVFTRDDLNAVARAQQLPKAELNLLLDALLTAGLLTREGETGYAFIHPTFQEHALARAWLFPDGDERNVSVQTLEQRFTKAVQDNQSEVEFEETLALALSVAVHKRVSSLKLIQVMLEKKRSILPTWKLVSLIRRSGIPLEEHLVDYLISYDPVDMPKTLARWASGDAVLVRFMQDFGLKQLIAQNELASEALLIELARDKDSDIRTLVARNPGISKKIMSILTKDNWHVRRSLASNRNLDEVILKQLAKDENSDVRRMIAENSMTENAILVQILQDKDWNARIGVAQNLRASMSILSQTAKDVSKYVRELTAENPNIDENLLIELSNDDEWCVRAGVARNETINEKLLFKLASDDDKRVRRVVAWNINTTYKILLELTNDPDYLVRTRVASNGKSDKLILLKLINDSVSLVRNAVAENDKASLEMLTKLKEDEDELVRETASARLF